MCARYVRRTVYILTGFGGAAAALGLIRTPHTLLFYAAGVLMYDFFTGINYTAFTSLEYEIVGSGNPLASTQFALLSASANLPISYMTAVDGHFHTTHGLGGMLAVDALSSVVVGTSLLLVFHRIGAYQEEDGDCGCGLGMNCGGQVVGLFACDFPSGTKVPHDLWALRTG